MIKQAMWTHGHSMTIEYPNRVTSLEKKGYFMRVRGNAFSSNWFHFAIPTPVIVDGNRLSVDSVLLRFRTGGATSLKAVHVWDAERRILTDNTIENPTSGAFRMSKFPVPSSPDVRFGIGISLKVEFGDSAGFTEEQRPLMFDVSSAGFGFMS